MYTYMAYSIIQIDFFRFTNNEQKQSKSKFKVFFNLQLSSY